MINKIKVAVCGACGKMGQEVVKAVTNQTDMEIVAAIDFNNVGKDIGNVVENKTYGVKITPSLEEAINETKIDVLIDFTAPDSVYKNTINALNQNIRPVIGTTGLSQEQLDNIKQLSSEKKLGALIAPNFAVGAVLMMMFAAKASQYFENAEIIELHHNKKKDSPSGTAIKTAQLMTQYRPQFGKDNCTEVEIIKGARGGITESNIHIHSVRLPGYIAHQEVIFGAPGESLLVRHDSFDRASFMPGIILSVRQVMNKPDFIYGLENIL